MDTEWSHEWHLHDFEKLKASADKAAPEEQGVFVIRQFQGRWVYVKSTLNIRRGLAKDLTIAEALCIFFKGHGGLEYSFELRDARQSEYWVRALIERYRPICNLKLAGRAM